MIIFVVQFTDAWDVVEWTRAFKTIEAANAAIDTSLLEKYGPSFGLKKNYIDPRTSYEIITCNLED